MGTCIEAVATAHHRGHLLGRGALHLAETAARACLDRAHREPDELDLLIDTGMYRDLNIAEPALAAIIQDDLGANRGSPPRIGHHGTFSFDVMNGGCGVVSSAQLADGLLAGGGARLGMVVAADADPSPRTSRHFPFAPAGGAVLLAHVPGEHGFARFAIRTYPQHAGLFETQLVWDPRAGLARRGRNVLEVYEAPDFRAACVARGAELVRELLDGAGLAAGEIELLIASQYPATFAQEIARALGIAPDAVPAVAPELACSHSAGPIAALDAAFASGRFTSAARTLFVTCGAGLTIAAALYHRGR
ncbi:MAG TPA: 3-oxoacyl-[acyl-carrier-protein] synthase III C-terminal domain-containing protein [Kofleriaceae bacterium]|nr:3-oxoacyl-[acyl-carrier-protein] synthase III C-terminal domain-containing protein [Kofleriaceae bacterium]